MNSSLGQQNGKNQKPLPLQEVVKWVAAGFALTLVSPKYYREVVRKGILIPSIFFFLLMTSTALLVSVRLTREMFSSLADIQQGYAEGEIPVIRIQDGVAVIEGESPFVILDEPETLFAADTSGKYIDIDQEKYSSGILLTESELHMLDNVGRYQKMQLMDFHELLNENPIIIDQEWTRDFLSSFFTILSGIIVVILFLWYNLGWLIYLLFLGWSFYIMSSAFRPQSTFNEVITLGMLASMPAFLLDYLLSFLGLDFIFLKSLLVFIFWGIGLLVGLRETLGGFIGSEAPLKLGRAWLGVPILGVVAGSMVFEWEYVKAIVWGVSLSTFALLVFLGFYTDPESGLQTD